MTRRPAGLWRTLLGSAVGLTLLAGAASVLVAVGVAGRAGLFGALVAVALVTGFLLVGQVPLAQAARGRRRVGAALLLLLYTARVMLLLVAFRVFYMRDGVSREALGLTVIACAAAWTAGTVWSALRWRPLVVEPEGDAQPEQGVDQRAR